MDFCLSWSIDKSENLEMVPKLGFVDAIVMGSFERVFDPLNLSNEAIESY